MAFVEAGKRKGSNIIIKHAGVSVRRINQNCDVAWAENSTALYGPAEGKHTDITVYSNASYFAVTWAEVTLLTASRR